MAAAKAVRIEQLGGESILNPQDGDSEPVKQFKRALIRLSAFLHTSLPEEFLNQREKIHNVNMMDQVILAAAFIIYKGIVNALTTKKQKIPEDFLLISSEVYHSEADKVVQQMVSSDIFDPKTGPHTAASVQAEALYRYLDIIWQTLQPYIKQKK